MFFFRKKGNELTNGTLYIVSYLEV